jgi:hypothetical protein
MLFEFIDELIAESLGVSVETYIDVIENKCTIEEADFIIGVFFEEDGDEQLAKDLFNSKLK